MRTIETALLYVDHPPPAFDQLCAGLNGRLEQFDISFAATTSDSGNNLVLSGPGMQVVITLQPRPLPADGFLHAMDSPLSSPFKGVLSDALFRHKSHALVSVIPSQTAGAPSTEALLMALRVAHAVCTLISEWHRPAAVHWRQSNQMITGAQYARLASDPTPWALFAQARVFTTTVAPEGKRRYGLRLDEATEFIGRPILFHDSDLSVEEIYASALSFLRHGVESGAPIPDGHTFGPEGGQAVTVQYVAPTAELPQGRYELSAQPTGDAADQATDPARNSHAAKTQALDELAKDLENRRRAERRRSLAISYLMLLIVPPIGLLLLFSNLFFGANAGRTGLIASTSVAAVILVGAFTFLRMSGDDIADLMQMAPITTDRIVD